MKLKYKIITLVIIIVSISTGILSLNADDNKIVTWYDLYKQRNLEICSTYTPDNAIFSTEKFPNLNENTDEENTIYSIDDNDLEAAQNIYIHNVNNIYKCAMLNAQERSINFIMDELSEAKETGPLNNAYTAQLENLATLRGENNCLNTNTSNNPLDKKKYAQSSYSSIMWI